MNISHFGNEYSSRLWFTIYKKKRIETKIHPRPREILREIATTIIRKKYSPGSRRREGFRKRKTTLREIDARKRNTARRPWRFQIYHTARSREVKPWSSRISSQDLPVRSFVPTYSRCNSKRGCRGVLLRGQRRGPAPVSCRDLLLMAGNSDGW